MEDVPHQADTPSIFSVRAPLRFSGDLRDHGLESTVPIAGTHDPKGWNSESQGSDMRKGDGGLIKA